MISLESLKELGKVSALWDVSLKQLIKEQDKTSYFKLLLGDNSKDRDEIDKLKREFIEKFLPKDFVELLPCIKVYQQEQLEKIVLGTELENLYNKNSQLELNLPKNSKNYSIEFKPRTTGEFGIDNPEVTILDNETNRKFVLNCGIGNVDWLKTLNISTTVKPQQLKVISEILKDKDGVLKINCKDGKITYIAETKVKDLETNKLETKRISRDSLEELMATISIQYNKVFQYLSASLEDGTKA